MQMDKSIVVHSEKGPQLQYNLISWKSDIL